MQIKNQALETVNDVLNFISPQAGGSIPSETSKQYANLIRWLQVKLDEYARRGYWRRLLSKTTLSANAGDTSIVLPNDFHRANGLYVFNVGDEDWAEEGQSKLFVSMITDDEDEDFGKWQVEFYQPLEQDITPTVWYFKSPPFPTQGTDKVILPGDLLGYGILTEYFRSTGAVGSQDDARNEAENRFTSYITQENIPARYELIQFNTRPRKIINVWNKRLYANRINRNLR